MRHNTLLVALVLLLAPRALAYEGWESGAHVGYAVAQRTTTGFDNVGGSLAYFDLARRFDDDVAAGMRTLMQGGRGSSSEYYRLGVGPYASYRATEKVAVEMALSRFSESALDAGGERTYKSSGYGVMLGWERRTYASERLAVSWGGFVGWHQGRLDAVAATSGRGFRTGAANTGLTRGLALSLAFRP